jgi:hypothetical protein
MTPAAFSAVWPCLVLAACSPALDWREVRPEGSGAVLLFPCRPVAQERRLPLAGQPVQLKLLACSAGGQTWGLAQADLGDPALLGLALAQLRAAAAANIGATAAGSPLALQVPGATPHDGSARVRLAGRLPGGAAAQMQVAVFTRGTQVYQATALGEALGEEAAETFFSSIRFPP